MHRTTTLMSLVAVVALVASCGSETATMTTIEEVTTTTVVEATTTTTPDTTSTTAAETTTTAVEEPIVPGEDPEVDAIVAVYTVAFDSTTTFEEKAAVIVEATGLEETVAAYATTGESMGGVTTKVDAVVISGDSAEITYTLMFAGNPTYPGLKGDAVRTEDGWKISRDMFCGIMTSAQVGCPTE
ncbi:MAG TPA: hypothetical protein VI980_05805 [Acidimicrobiia bacterium]|nr:hypothetical protein [Acidimicrobiia bacterium]